MATPRRPRTSTSTSSPRSDLAPAGTGTRARSPSAAAARTSRSSPRRRCRRRAMHRVVGARDVPALVHQQSPEPAGQPLVLLPQEGASRPRNSPLSNAHRPRQARPRAPSRIRRGPGRRADSPSPAAKMSRAASPHGVTAERFDRPSINVRPQVDRDVLIGEQLEPDLARVARPGRGSRDDGERRLDALHERRDPRPPGRASRRRAARLRALDGQEAPVLVVHRDEGGPRRLSASSGSGGPAGRVRARSGRRSSAPVRQPVDDQVLDHAAARRSARGCTGPRRRRPSARSFVTTRCRSASALRGRRRRPSRGA